MTRSTFKPLIFSVLLLLVGSVMGLFQYGRSAFSQVHTWDTFPACFSLSLGMIFYVEFLFVNLRRGKVLVPAVAAAISLWFLSFVIVPNHRRVVRSENRSRERVQSKLGAIRATQVAHVAEWNFYVGNQPPTPVRDRRGHSENVAWNSNTRFSIIGFSPGGDVYCSYSLEGSDWPSLSEGFTARAHCDLDGDGNVSVFTITNFSTEITHSGGTF